MGCGSSRGVISYASDGMREQQWCDELCTIWDAGAAGVRLAMHQMGCGSSRDVKSYASDGMREQRDVHSYAPYCMRE